MSREDGRRAVSTHRARRVVMEVVMEVVMQVLARCSREAAGAAPLISVRSPLISARAAPRCARLFGHTARESAAASAEGETKPRQLDAASLGRRRVLV